MGRAVLRGISTALLVTVLTLLAGILWSSTGLGVVSISQLVDIGLVVSCFTGGYRTGKETRQWISGTLVGAGFVTIGSLLLALFTPVRGIGFLQVLLIGALLSSVAGAFGAGSLNRKVSYSSGTRSDPAYTSDTWLKTNKWQAQGEDEWARVYDKQMFNPDGEDGKIEGDYLKLGAFEGTSFSKGNEEAKEYSGQSSSPWWEEDFKSMHNA